MSTATFECIPEVTIQRERHLAGNYVNGTWVSGGLTPESPEDIEAVLMPVTSGTKLSSQMKKEIDNNRSSKYMVGYAVPGTFQVMDEVNGIDPDIIIYNSERYEVVMMDSWAAGVLDHEKALLVRLDVRDGS